MDDEKMASIKNLQRPLTKRSLKRALGLFGHYKAHIRNFSAKSYLLTEMLLKNKPDRLVWTENQIEAFEELRACLMEKPVLHSPDRSHGYVMQTDISLFAISAVLLQRIDGNERVIAYAFRKLLPRQSRFSTIERELLAVMFGLNKYEQYIYGREIRLKTDHKPLLYLKSLADKSSRAARWAMLIQKFNIQTSHLPRKLNVIADALSRL